MNAPLTQYDVWRKAANNSIICGVFGFACPLLGVWGIVGLAYGLKVTHSPAPENLKTRAIIGIVICIIQVTLIFLALLLRVR